MNQQQEYEDKAFRQESRRIESMDDERTAEEIAEDELKLENAELHDPSD